MQQTFIKHTRHKLYMSSDLSTNVNAIQRMTTSASNSSPSSRGSGRVGMGGLKVLT